MENDFRDSIARMWQRILRTDATTLFGAEAGWVVVKNAGDEMAQPGFVGKSYSKGGVMFLAMHAGIGEGEGSREQGYRQIDKLTALRNASKEDRLMAFDELMEVLDTVMRTWKTVQNYVDPVMSRGGLDLSHVAYVNLINWRTETGARLEDLYEISWKDHTREQVEMLRAGGDSGDRAIGRECVRKACIASKMLQRNTIGDRSQRRPEG